MKSFDSSSLLAVAAIATLFTAPAALAAFSGTNGRIAFERDGGIWSMNADGSDARQLVGQSGDSSFNDPCFSPDGRKIVFESNQGAIWQIALGSTFNTLTNLTAGHPAGSRRDPDFLPNGKIVYIEKKAASADVYQMEADGTSPVNLTPGNTLFLFSPASGSTGVIYVSGNQDIYQVSGGTLTNVTNTTPDNGANTEGEPDVSPAGVLIFNRNTLNPNDTISPKIYKGATLLAGDAADGHGYAAWGAWSPAGDKIAYLSDNGANLWIMDADGGNKIQITGPSTPYPSGISSVDWGPAVSGTGTDSTPPQTSLGSSKPAAITRSRNAAFTLTGTDNVTPPAALALSCSLDSAAFAPCTASVSYSNLKEGTHTFRARAADAAGNIDVTPATWTWTIDLTPPTTKFTGTLPPKSTKAKTAKFKFTGTDKVTPAAALVFQYKLDAAGWKRATSPLNLTGLKPATHTLSVRAIDQAGNSDSTPAAHTWKVTK